MTPIALKAYEIMDLIAKAFRIKINMDVRARAAPLYRHPENRRKQWSGKKPKPPWVVEWEKSGKDIEECRI